MPTRELEDIVRRAQRGDAAAFAELFRKHRNAVAAIAYRMLGPGADLEDMVQEVFLQVHRSLPDFRGQSKFSTWLHRVTVNVVLMARRRARSRPQYAQEDHARHEADVGPAPDQEVARSRRVEAFRRLLDKLSDKKRDVFVLHELEGLAPGEIAKIVNCPVLTVRTRLFYARRELAQMMRAEPALSHLADASEGDAGSASGAATPLHRSVPPAGGIHPPPLVPPEGGIHPPPLVPPEGGIHPPPLAPLVPPEGGIENTRTKRDASSEPCPTAEPQMAAVEESP